MLSTPAHLLLDGGGNGLFEGHAHRRRHRWLSAGFRAERCSETARSGAGPSRRRRRITMRIEITIATIGRLMKNLAMLLSVFLGVW